LIPGTYQGHFDYSNKTMAIKNGTDVSPALKLAAGINISKPLSICLNAGYFFNNCS